MRLGRAELAGRAPDAPEPSIVLYTGPVWRSNLPWPAMTAGAALLSALAGWLLSAGFSLLGWLGVLQVNLAITLRLATQGWLVAHGVEIGLPGGRLSIAPLGLTFILWFIASGMAGQVGRQVHATDLDVTERRRWVLRIGGLFAIVYGVLVASIAGSSEGGAGFLTGLGGGLLVGALGGFRGAGKAIGWRLSSEIKRLGWPRWWDALPRAIAVGTLLVVAAAASVVALAFFRYRDRVVALHEALEPDALGDFLLMIGQLGFLPNVIAWATSWVSGAGIGFGIETLISPVANQIGMVPAVPMLGAIPPAGPGPAIALAWLAAVAVAGIAAALVLLRSQARDHEARGLSVPRPDLTTVTGGLAGIAAALVICLIAYIAGGDLGQVRLIAIGARFPAMLIMTPTIMGLAGMVAGLAYGFARYRRARTP